ncbi:phosphotransferase family protein [Paenibacillus sp. FJAT-26967]|uniref:phosphotransferase family protein n=1 Tax=Paenibacillus sp. FJAT-26967 TaxID=1729690 RepID=UPI00083984C0|nr:aminoglycoside phosphotransferase family protein [Paenibacillus sp. FJAT-26967]
MNRLTDLLPDHVLQWVVNAADPQADVVSIQRLYGGISSLMHSITLNNSGIEKSFVLRQLTNKEWLSEEPDLALHEAESLRWAAQIQVPTPEAIAFDGTGEASGVPAVLMTRLEGSVVLSPPDRELWVDGMAEALALVHRTDAEGFPWAHFRYNDPMTVQKPLWSRHPHLWEEAFKIIREAPPAVQPCFIHRDYHPANVLWKDHAVSGIVDWVNACRGPAGIDVGHCRVDLAQMFGVETADAFLGAYISHAGRAFTYQPYWDLVSLVDILFGTPEVYAGWTDLGMTGLTNELIIERLDDYLVSLLKRV